MKRVATRIRCASLLGTMGAALAVLGGAALPSCKAKERAIPPVAAGDPLASAPAPLAADAAAPPRCVVSPVGLAVTSAEERRFLSVGDAVAVPGGFAVGLVRSFAGNIHASMARVRGDLASMTVVDLGPIAADAPPPRPILHEGVLYALAALTAAPRGDAQAVSVARARPDGGVPKRVTPLVLSRVLDASAEALGAVQETADESLGADALIGAGAALIAWDEDAPARDRGLIKVAHVAFGAPAEKKPQTGTIVSPEGSDAEAPRLAPRAGGAWLVWTARRPEPLSDAAIDDTRIEAPAERRVFQWIEIVALDDHGAIAGAVRKLTPPTGHAGAFDLAPRPGGDLDVLVRDDDEASEGAGGAVRRYSVRGDAVEGPVTIAPDGVGRGTVDVIAGTNGEWLAFDDPTDHTRVVPLGDARARAAPSVEPALDGARLLVTLGEGVVAGAPGAPGGPGVVSAGPEVGATSLVAVFPSADAQLRRVVCGR